MHRLLQSWSTNTKNVETQTNSQLDVISPRQIKYKDSSPIQQCQNLSQTLEEIQTPILVKIYPGSNSYNDNYSGKERGPVR